MWSPSPIRPYACSGQGNRVSCQTPNKQLQRTCQRVKYFACAKCAPLCHAAELRRYAARSLVAAFALLGLFAQSDLYAQQSSTLDLLEARRVVATLRDLPTPLPIVGNGIH